jgi:hypothetical protein
MMVRINFPHAIMIMITLSGIGLAFIATHSEMMQREL